MVMEVRTPNGRTPAERWRTVSARFTEDSVFVTIMDSGGTTGRNFATGGALTVPHASMQYSVIEYEIAGTMISTEARTGPSQLSVRDTARTTSGDASFEVDYSRPLAHRCQRCHTVHHHGRHHPRRTGSSCGDLHPMDPAPREWSAVDRESPGGPMGTTFDQAQNLGTAPMQAETDTTPAEQFIISVVSFGDQTGALVMEWGTFRWTAPIRVR